MSEAGRVEFVEQRLSDVAAYYAKDFQPRQPGDGLPELLEFFVDPAKDRIIFRLYIPRSV